MSGKLKPCPKCGAKNSHAIFSYTEKVMTNDRILYVRFVGIRCDDCGFSLDGYLDIDEAVTMWNNLEYQKGCEGCKYECENKRRVPCILCPNNFKLPCTISSNKLKSQWTAKDDKIEVGDEVVMNGEDAKTDGTEVITWIGGKSGYCSFTACREVTE